MSKYYSGEAPTVGDLVKLVQDEDFESEYIVSRIRENGNIDINVDKMGIIDGVNPMYYTLEKTRDEIKEEEILEKTAEIWNTFLKLEQTHPCDIDELCDGIHAIQKIIALRMARRNRPDIFPIKK